MSENVLLPELGESVNEGVISRWLKAVGDAVEVGEALLEVSTDKVDTEVPSTVAGVLLEIVAPEDAEVKVGDVLAVIGSTVSGQAASPAGDDSPVPAVEPTPAVEPVETTTTATATSSRPYATPVAKKIAADQGIDLTAIVGTGLGGRIRKDDVLAASATQPPTPTVEQSAPVETRKPAAAPAAVASSPAAAPSLLRGTTAKMSRMRAIIAERMVEALHTQAQLTTVVEVDVTKLAALRARAKDAFKAREGANLTFLPFYARAAAEALKAFPKLNATISDDGTEVTYHGHEHLGIAVDTERGLMVPVVKDAGNLNLAGLAKSIGDLGARTKASKVTAEELQGATFTITNTGSGGALIDTPIVPVGQTAILGTGTITKRPAVITVDGVDVIAIRQFAYLFVSYDHRLVDGADAARFLMAIKARIEEAAFEAEVGL
ncbi:MAG: 2-oxoglutarate dehydrogenase, E2 component, dihydrolipoamide succinyltransferase [Promicromonosporaceae bacterium]|nr:2-oxoglutarate dehydrogenase, E2 component, dihydrolipoamide succinyltransferase [Promicromonosporaceae bacterium]